MDPLSYLFSLEHFGIKFGLENITAIVERLGRPDRTFKSVHVAGTNGKGSVTAMVDAALRAAGHRTARYTSPHLTDLSERFVIGGRPVAHDTLVCAVATVRDVVESLRFDGTLGVQPTFFEVTTAAAFELFRRAEVEIAVLEVGLGGRLDATNIVSPFVTAITSIALDHQLYLGSTLAEIAFEKAGIIKAGVPVVVGPVDPESLGVIARVANERGAALIRATPADAAPFTLGLYGDHQRANAGVAVRVLEQLTARGVGVPSDAVARGLADPEWPGRLDQRRLPDGRELLLDAAHNPAGAAALATYLTAESQRRPLVFAAMRDKDIDGMFRILLPAIGAAVMTRASNPRSADPGMLADSARRIAPALPIAIEPSSTDALAAVWRMSPRIVVAGSIFLLGDVMRQLGLHSY
ncbi:MAG: bifunctional folylpolyglutamate synthase/dihydrofolate synthase [Acidobacteria bacterium]|nr:MAG: bifunctional folylpolyglutamate synthase/dihydrofolate synthase [Acidobacteriota bacterium]PYQ86979.1 MAG: bifunctional folylpolyglutamate synthase/dihydrofolate synthase [Acidobacteriota bacterium]